MQVFCRVEHWFFGKCWAAFIFVLNFFALHMKFLYKSFFLSTDIHLSTTSHSRVSSHFHRHIFQKKKKKSFQPYPLTLLWYWALQIIFIKLSIQFNLSLSLSFWLLSYHTQYARAMKKKKICWVSNIVQVCFHALLNDTLYNSFYRSGLRLLCDFLHLNMFLYSSRQYSTIRLW